MSSFVKKLMATGAALSIGISSFAVADYYHNYNCCPPPCCDPCAKWCDNISFNAAWLYWKASGDDFQYAVEKERFATGTSGTAGTLFTSREKIHDIKFDWDSGFRIGVGLDLPSTCWGINVDWTHYDSSSSSKTHIEGETTPPRNITAGFPVVGAGFTTGILADGDSVDFRGSVKLRYNTIDIEMGKWLCCGNSALMFRPHVGLRLADIQERFRDEVRANGSGVEFRGDFSGAAFAHQNRFKGIGVRAGLDVDLFLCDGWSIIGRSAASAVWGTTHLRNRLLTSSPVVADSDTDYIREDYRQTRFFTDLSLGVRWKTMACGCYLVTVELAWEHHYLFNQHRYWVDNGYADFDASSAWRSTGDMALQGLTLSAGFDF